MDLVPSDNQPWFAKAGPESDVVLSSRVRLARNLIDHPFPNTLGKEEEKEVRDRLVSAFSRLPDRRNFTILYLKELAPLERRILLERNIIGQAYSLEAEKALILSKDQTVSALLNEQDHVRLACVREGLSLSEAYEVVDRLDSCLEESLPFACSLEWGYLNSSLKDVGTGMRGSLMVHLPALVMTGLIDKALKIIAQVGLSVRGFFGRRNASLGDMYQMSNQISLGLSEEELLENLERVAGPLIEYERQARSRLEERQRVELEDKVFRAWGVLTSCRSIGTREAVTLLSRLRLGISLGLIENVSLETVTSLFFLAQRSHVQAAVEPSQEQKVVDFARARIIREKLVAADYSGGNHV